MKALVVFYSRTGLTKKAANAIADTMGCEIDEVSDSVNRAGVMGYIMAGKAAMGRSLTTIQYALDPSKYDLVIIGTPIWAWNMTPAIRTYLSQNKDKLRDVAFFCTMGGQGGVKTFAEMGSIIGKKPLGTFELTAREVSSGEYGQRLKTFIADLNKSSKQSP